MVKIGEKMKTLKDIESLPVKVNFITDDFPKGKNIEAKVETDIFANIRQAAIERIKELREKNKATNVCSLCQGTGKAQISGDVNFTYIEKIKDEARIEELKEFCNITEDDLK